MLLTFTMYSYRIVKLSSPRVNVMIIAGAIIFYATVILFGVDENTASFSVVDGLCHARVWLCVIGFSLLFGTIFAKAWRIYYIFHHSRPNKKLVSNFFEITVCLDFHIQDVGDIYLIGIVSVLLMLDIIFMLPPTIISSSILRIREKELEGKNVSSIYTNILHS